MENRLNDLSIKVAKYNQQHILNGINQLSEQTKLDRIEEINKIDFEQINKLIELTKNTTVLGENVIEPVTSIDKALLTECESNEYQQIGLNAMKKGEYALVTMAGGQGTRLGINAPKGTYILNLITGKKSLFEVFTLQLKVFKEKYDTYIHWYIMTSVQNNEETITFFERNNYFGYNKEYIHFFIQGELPMLTLDEKLLVEDVAKVKMASNGNGGVFESVHKTGMLNHMKQNGVQWVYISGVDNILVNNVDSMFLGMTIKKGHILASKSVEKILPNEKVGVFCMLNGKPGIVEYTELSEEQSFMKKQDGSLVFSEAFIVQTLFNIQLLDELSIRPLPYHVAIKRADYMNNQLQMVISETPNAYKFEMYIFDAFKYAKELLLLRVKREDEFAPLKNKEGTDSIETATNLYNNYIKQKGNNK